MFSQLFLNNKKLSGLKNIHKHFKFVTYLSNFNLNTNGKGTPNHD